MIPAAIGCPPSRRRSTATADAATKKTQRVGRRTQRRRARRRASRARRARRRGSSTRPRRAGTSSWPSAAGSVPRGDLRRAAGRTPRLDASERGQEGTVQRTVTRRDVDKLQEEIEELFADLWQVPRFSGLRHGFRPNLDCFHTDDPHALTVVVELPGVDPQSVRVVVGERVLVDRRRAQAPQGSRARLPADGDRVRPVPAAGPARSRTSIPSARARASSTAC